MFWTVEKLEQRIKELSSYRYRGLMEINDWEYAVDNERIIGSAPPPVLKAERSVGKGDRWSGRDLYVWLRKQVLVPQEWSGRKVVGLFDFGETGGGHNSGFESLLFVDGQPYQGVDSNHREVLLEQASAGRELSLCFRLWTGLEGGGVPKEQHHEVRQAALAWLDEPADNLYYTGRAVLESVKVLGEDRQERHELLKALDRAFAQLDWFDVGSEAFYQSVERAEAKLLEELARLQQTHPVTVHCIGHTHIDVAWLWRLQHTREKAARSFSTVLRLMEQYPEYVFLQTQPQLYEYIKHDYPEIYEQMKARIAEGRWEAGGAMWLESDCNLVSGESLVRQLLYGTRFLKEEFGVTCDYLWLPDVFGYSWALPQILKKSGIRTFMTTKISWNQYNRMPHDTFQWRGIDGSEVLTHFVTTPEVPGSTVWWYTYNGTTEPFAVKGIWDTYRDKEVNNELLLSYGYGDGGGGVNRDMLEMRRRLEEMPGIPKAVPGRVDDYFARLHEAVDTTDRYVHTWDGELYLEYHRGTYTSQGFIKKMNRKLELLFRETEWLQVFAGVAAGSWSAYPAEQLTLAWKTVLRNQFHDIIPGSSIPEVYEDARIEYEQARLLGQEAWDGAASALTTRNMVESARPVGIPAHSVPYTLWNNASFSRTDRVLIPAAETGAAAGSWTDGSGSALTAQRSGDNWLIQVRDLPQLGGSTIHFVPGGGAPEALEEAVPFVLEGRTLHTPFYILEWNDKGQLGRIFDREAGREVLAPGEAGNVFQLFEDKPKMFEAWDIDLFYQEKQYPVDVLESFECTAMGPLAASMRLSWTFGHSRIEQTMTVYADSRRMDFETEVDWQERQRLLKVAFPVTVRATEATYDIQFGNVKRPTHWNTSWDYARFETVGHQWADLSERGYGVSFLNDCKYGHDIKDNVIRLSLLKSAMYPDPQADRGVHSFKYALLPHKGDWVEGRTQQEAWMLNNPLSWLKGAAALSGKSLLKLDTEGVMIDAVKKAEDGDDVIVRIHEWTGTRCHVQLTSDLPLTSWQECDLMENPEGEVFAGPAISLPLTPYEIKTFRVKFA
ncbi:alpha-mannosidase [Paenibacillus albidus]|uniref:Alpha-mannosidase n=1 Tax=Paenibacillus albidus TaxID=2041023 RepID=A0A917BW95_9BACL|nr:alpha-mannosidase [Paenibacillus albidus]GGF59935.1 alpha-mannosidase [Paenibacillus albidus]